MAEEGKRGRGRPKKAEFADLPDEFKDGVTSLDEAQVRDLVAKVAMCEEENKKLCKADQHLQEVKEMVKDAGSQYREASKMNSLKIRFLKDVLEGRGKKTTE